MFYIPTLTTKPHSPLDSITKALVRGARVTRNALARGREYRFWEAVPEKTWQEDPGVFNCTYPHAPGAAVEVRPGLTPEMSECDAIDRAEREDEVEDGGEELEQSWDLISDGDEVGPGYDWRLSHFEGGELGLCDRGGITTKTIDEETKDVGGAEAWEEMVVVPFSEWYGDADGDYVTPAVWGAGCACRLCHDDQGVLVEYADTSEEEPDILDEGCVYAGLAGTWGKSQGYQGEEKHSHESSDGRG